MTLNVYKRTRARLPLGQKGLSKIISRVARILGKETNFEITILLVGDKEIRSLNKKFRHKDKVTDVLSFSQREGAQLILPRQEGNYLGDIVICYAQAKRQAKIYGQSLTKEFTLLLIHGFLHLLGYSDERKKDYQKMEKIQNKIFNKIYGTAH
jgi:probable rRNA maturation factor